MYEFLKRRFKQSNLAAMSLWYVIVFVTSFIGYVAIVNLIIFGLSWLLGTTDEELGDSVFAIVFLGCLLIAICFLVWLWIAFVRIARSWNQTRLGAEVFKIIQIAVLVFVPISMFLQGRFMEDLKLLPLIVLGFDCFILVAVFIFFPLAWHTGYKIPRRTYFDMLAIMLLIACQLLLVWK